MTLIVANWKMYLSLAQSEALAEEAVALSGSLEHARLWIAPPLLALYPLVCRFRASTVRFGAQNVHWAESGAYTGEISRLSLEELGCSFAIVGHSERRHKLGESNEIAARRACGALSSHLTVILCVGETAEQHKAKQALSAIKEQIEPVLSAVDVAHAGSLIVAYEPVWAVGTGVTPSCEQIAEVHALIGDYCRRHLNHNPPILYGGSVTAKNCIEILSIPGVAGALVGKASLEKESLGALLAAADQLAR